MAALLEILEQEHADMRRLLDLSLGVEVHQRGLGPVKAEDGLQTLDLAERRAHEVFSGGGFRMRDRQFRFGAEGRALSTPYRDVPARYCFVTGLREA